MNFNQVTIGGRLTRKPDLRTISSGTSVCEFGVAINRKYKDKEETTFVDVTAWGKTAETIAKYMDKGREILITGRLTLDSWKDNAGQNRSKLKVTANEFQFVGSSTSPRPCPAGTQAPPVADDDIPF